MADADRAGPDVVTRLGQILGLAAGFVALVYIAGGGVLALRLYLGHLPSRTIVGHLPRELVISVGLAQVVLPVLGVTALYAAYRSLRGKSPPPKRLTRQWKERSWRGWATLVAASAIPALLAAGTLASGAEEGRGLLWLAAVIILLTLLVVLIALSVRARLADRYATPNEWNSLPALVRMTLLVALASVPTAIVLAGTRLPLLEAKLCTTSGSEVTGILIGETSDRTYIGEEEPEGMRRDDRDDPLLVFSVPRTQITETFIGGDAGSRPCSAVDTG